MCSGAFLHADRDEWKDLLQHEIGTATHRHTGTSSWVNFVEPSATADLIVCLGSLALAQDSSADALADTLLRAGVCILPIVSDLSKFSSEAPPALRMINGMTWSNPGAIAEEVLRHLGLTERDRRVFLCHLRWETTPPRSALYVDLHSTRF